MSRNVSPYEPVIRRLLYGNAMTAPEIAAATGYPANGVLRICNRLYDKRILAKKSLVRPKQRAITVWSMPRPVVLPKMKLGTEFEWRGYAPTGTVVTTRSPM